MKWSLSCKTRVSKSLYKYTTSQAALFFFFYRTQGCRKGNCDLRFLLSHWSINGIQDQSSKKDAWHLNTFISANVRSYSEHITQTCSLFIGHWLRLRNYIRRCGQKAIASTFSVFPRLDELGLGVDLSHTSPRCLTPGDSLNRIRLYLMEAIWKQDWDSFHHFTSQFNKTLVKTVSSCVCVLFWYGQGTSKGL